MTLITATFIDQLNQGMLGVFSDVFSLIDAEFGVINQIA